MPGSAELQARKLHPALGWAAGLSGLLALAAIVFGWPAPVIIVSAVTALLILMGLRAGKADLTQRKEPFLPDAPLDSRVIQILDIVPSPTILVDRRGVVLDANRAALRSFPGFRIGFPFSAAIRTPDVLAALDRVLAGQAEANAGLIEQVPIERSFSLAIGKLASANDSAARSENQPHAVIHMTETTQLRQVEAMRVDFVANASHELRTPLASILGFIETLQGPARDDSKARPRFLDIMKAQAQRMARLIDDLLSLSRIEMRVHVPPSGTANLRLILPQLKDALSGLARERGVEIRLEMPEEVHGEIPGDADELTRAIENLIENAIKYGQSGRFVDVALTQMPESQVSPRPDNASKEIRISVRDYGPGIAWDHQPRLTERFYRADIRESRILGGTGLGLAIVKHIVMRHNGRLVIESAPDHGATFAIILKAE